MNQIQKKEEYKTPDIKVITVNIMQVMCFSGDPSSDRDPQEDAFKENGFSWSSYIGAEKWEEAKDFMPYDETSKILKPEYDIAHKILGGDWRMPTSADFVALFEACGGAGKVIPPSEVPGAINEDGSLKKGIYRCEYDQHTFDYIKVPGMLFVDGSGNYWSSELYGSQKDYALFMFLDHENVAPQFSSNRFFGLSIRPVSD